MFITLLGSVLSLIVGVFIGIRIGLFFKLEKEAIANTENTFEPDINESKKETTNEVSKNEIPRVVICPGSKDPYIDNEGKFHLEIEDVLDPITDEVNSKTISYINDGLSLDEACLNVASDALDNTPFSNKTKKFLRDNIISSTKSDEKTLDEIYQEAAGAAIDYMYANTNGMFGKKNDIGDIGPEPINENTDNTFTPADISNIEVCNTLTECSIPDTIARVDIIKNNRKKINANSDYGYEYQIHVLNGRILKPGHLTTNDTVCETILLPSEMADATEDEKYEYAVKFMNTVMTPTTVKRKPLPKFDEKKFLGVSDKTNKKSNKPKKTKKSIKTDDSKVTTEVKEENPAPKKRGRKKKEQ